MTFDPYEQRPDCIGASEFLEYSNIYQDVQQTNEYHSGGIVMTERLTKK